MNPTLLNYLQLIRAPAVFTALSNILAAQLILTQGELHWGGLLLLLLASSVFYSAGMVLNDWFDYAIDCVERPRRPLPSGKISRRRALIFALTLLLAGLALSAIAGPVSFYIGIALVLLILAYNARLKGTPAGAIAMGGCRYLNWLLGLSLFPLGQFHWLLPLPIFVYIVSLTLLSQQEESAADKSVALLTLAGIALAGLGLFGLVWSYGEPGWWLLLIPAGIVFLGARLVACYRDFNSARVQKTIGLLLLAIIPLDALAVLLFAPAWLALPVLLLLLPGKRLARMMYIT